MTGKFQHANQSPFCMNQDAKLDINFYPYQKRNCLSDAEAVHLMAEHEGYTEA